VVAGARDREPAYRRCLGHARHSVGQYQCGHHDDCREGFRPPSRTPAASGLRERSMRYVKLGRSDLTSSVLGLGCMGMSEFYGKGNDEESLRTLARALELGITMLDTSDLYGKGQNELLLGRFLKGRRDKVLLASKFGVLRDPEGPEGSTYDRDLDN